MERKDFSSSVKLTPPQDLKTECNLSEKAPVTSSDDRVVKETNTMIEDEKTEANSQKQEEGENGGASSQEDEDTNEENSTEEENSTDDENLNEAEKN